MMDGGAASHCDVCGRVVTSKVEGRTLPGTVVAALEKRRPGWTPAGRVCRDCVNEARASHLENVLEQAAGRPVPEAAPVIASIRDGRMSSPGSVDPMMAIAKADVAADRLTGFIATWSFVGLVLAGLAIWVSINLAFRPIEPYPVIILAMISAVLASIAALEGPIIMMSQRRSHRLEVGRTEQDYLVNLRAELEIRYLGEQIQHLLDLTEKASGEEPGN